MAMDLQRHGSGSSLLFIHGAGGTAKTWSLLQAQLASRFEVIVLDLPGHGSSSADGCRSIDEYAQILSEAMDRAGLRTCCAIGHSMGGAIAMRLALTRPSALSGLVLIGTGAKLKVFPAIIEMVLREPESAYRHIIDFAFSAKAPAAMKEAAYQEYLHNRA